MISNDLSQWIFLFNLLISAAKYNFTLIDNYYKQTAVMMSSTVNKFYTCCKKQTRTKALCACDLATVKSFS